MAQEVDIVDRVSVDVDGLGDLGQHAAIAPAARLKVLLRNRTTKEFRSLPVYGFTAAGEPLVPAGAHLTRAVAAAAPDESVHSILPETPSERLENPVGPFTPAPAGMTAVFDDGSRLPVAYYDVHGRACAINLEPISRTLFVLEEGEGLVRIDLPSSTSH